MLNKQGSGMYLEILGRLAYVILGVILGVWLITSGVLV
jgi:hypothetical protein